MNTGIVASRYAKALLRFAEDNKEEVCVYKKCFSYVGAFNR